MILRHLSKKISQDQTNSIGLITENYAYLYLWIKID
jgi:hypothetical protein